MNIKFRDYFYHMTDIPDIQQKTTPDNTGNQKPELYGVGGWLLFFWISLVFISPLYMVVSLHGYITSQEMSIPGLETIPLWGHIKGYNWISLICSILLLWFAGNRLVRRLEWKSVRLTILVIWLTGPVSVIIMAIYFYLMFPSFFRMAVDGFFTDFIESFSYPIIWTLYLLKSERVRNTYVKTEKPPSTI